VQFADKSLFFYVCHTFLLAVDLQKWKWQDTRRPIRAMAQIGVVLPELLGMTP
jgi:hypothetical protein